MTKKLSNVVIEEKKEAPKKAAAPATATPAAGGPTTLKDIFGTFAAGAKEMDGKTFAKFAKDCGVLNKACTTTDIDLIFAKVKKPADRKITYDQFKSGVELMAQKRGETAEALTSAVCAAGGPVFAGTKA